MTSYPTIKVCRSCVSSAHTYILCVLQVFDLDKEQPTTYNGEVSAAVCFGCAVTVVFASWFVLCLTVCCWLSHFLSFNFRYLPFLIACLLHRQALTEAGVELLTDEHAIPVTAEVSSLFVFVFRLHSFVFLTVPVLIVCRLARNG